MKIPIAIMLLLPAAMLPAKTKPKPEGHLGARPLRRGPRCSRQTAIQQKGGNAGLAVDGRRALLSDLAGPSGQPGG